MTLIASIYFQRVSCCYLSASRKYNRMAWLSTEFYFYKGSAPCRAVWMLIKALNVDVDEKEVDLLKAETKRPWFLRVSTIEIVSMRLKDSLLCRMLKDYYAD